MSANPNAHLALRLRQMRDASKGKPGRKKAQSSSALSTNTTHNKAKPAPTAVDGSAVSSSARNNLPHDENAHLVERLRKMRETQRIKSRHSASSSHAATRPRKQPEIEVKISRAFQNSGLAAPIMTDRPSDIELRISSAFKDSCLGVSTNTRKPRQSQIDAKISSAIAHSGEAFPIKSNSTLHEARAPPAPAPGKRSSLLMSDPPAPAPGQPQPVHIPLSPASSTMPLARAPVQPKSLVGSRVSAGSDMDSYASVTHRMLLQLGFQKDDAMRLALQLKLRSRNTIVQLRRKLLADEALLNKMRVNPSANRMLSLLVPKDVVSEHKVITASVDKTAVTGPPEKKATTALLEKEVVTGPPEKKVITASLDKTAVTGPLKQKAITALLEKEVVTGPPEKKAITASLDKTAATGPTDKKAITASLDKTAVTGLPEKKVITVSLDKTARTGPPEKKAIAVSLEKEAVTEPPEKKVIIASLGKTAVTGPPKQKAITASLEKEAATGPLVKMPVTRAPEKEIVTGPLIKALMTEPPNPYAHQKGQQERHGDALRKDGNESENILAVKKKSPRLQAQQPQKDLTRRRVKEEVKVEDSDSESSSFSTSSRKSLRQGQKRPRAEDCAEDDEFPLTCDELPDCPHCKFSGCMRFKFVNKKHCDCKFRLHVKCPKCLFEWFTT